MAVATVAYVVGFLIYYLAPSIGWFLLAEAFLGFAVAMLSGVASAFVFESLLEESRQSEDKAVFGRAASISLASVAVSSVIGSIAAEHIGIRFPLLLTAIAYAIAVLVVLMAREPKRSKSVERLSFSAYLRQMREGFGLVLQDKTLLSLAVDVAFLGGLLRVAYWYIQPRLVAVGIPMAYLGGLFAAMNLAAAVLVNLAPRIDKRLGSTKTVILLRVIGVLAIASLATPSEWAPAIAALVLVCSMQMRGVLYNAYFNRLVPSSHRATALSYIAVLGSVSYLIMGPLLGHLSDSLSTQAVLLGIACVTLPLAFVRTGLGRASLDESQ